jgi:hypothetical protein
VEFERVRVVLAHWADIAFLGVDLRIISRCTAGLKNEKRGGMRMGYDGSGMKSDCRRGATDRLK